jgi:hypothetical protein
MVSRIQTDSAAEQEAARRATLERESAGLPPHPASDLSDLQDPRNPLNEPGNVPIEDTPAARAERAKVAFDSEQEARRQAFERENAASVNKAKRELDMAEEKLKLDAKIAARRQELLDMSVEHGLVTHDDLLAQRDLMAPHAQNGALLPQEVFADGEETVLMAFPRTVILTLSANDVQHWVDPVTPGTTAPGIHHGVRVVFYQGYNDVPARIADHNYLFDAGAYRADESGTPESVEARNARIRDRTKAAKDEAAARDARAESAGQ